jgi:alpha-amylase
VSVEETIAYLRDNATADRSRIGLMGDDGEKFGGWPGTYELCWGEGQWMHRFFDAVEENADWIDTVRPSDWYVAHPPQGRVYVPTTSYLEMTEWALPPTEFVPFHTLLAEAKAADSPAQRFLFGGFWRAFAARYREINDLHKQMLRTSAVVAAMPDGPEHERALGHLLRGQSNDVYWHGLFGGIYLVHLRLAVAAELIGAYDLAVGGTPETRAADLDLDGVAEVELGGDGHLATVDVAEGAGIGSWDLFATRLAVASGMRRRPEAYHEILRKHFEERAAEDAASLEESRAPDDDAPVSVVERVAEASAAAMTTEEQVVLLHEGIEDLLVYDDHEVRGALVAFHDLTEARDAGPAELAQLALADLGDFAGGAHELVALSGAEATLRRLGTVGDRPLELTKRIRLASDRRTPQLTVELALVNPESIARAFEVDLSFACNMAGGGHNPAAYYAWTAGGAERTSFHDESGDLFGGVLVEFGNRDVGVAITAELDRPGRITWYPIETVSKSEGGYERVYQASSLHCRWPVVLAQGATGRVGVTFRAVQSRDLRDEEAAVEVAVAPRRNRRRRARRSTDVEPSS